MTTPQTPDPKEPKFRWLKWPPLRVNLILLSLLLSITLWILLSKETVELTAVEVERIVLVVLAYIGGVMTSLSHKD